MTRRRGHKPTRRRRRAQPPDQVPAVESPPVTLADSPSPRRGPPPRPRRKGALPHVDLPLSEYKRVVLPPDRRTDPAPKPPRRPQPKPPELLPVVEAVDHIAAWHLTSTGAARGFRPNVGEGAGRFLEAADTCTHTGCVAHQVVAVGVHGTCRSRTRYRSTFTTGREEPQ